MVFYGGKERINFRIVCSGFWSVLWFFIGFWVSFVILFNFGVWEKFG